MQCLLARDSSALTRLIILSNTRRDESHVHVTSIAKNSRKFSRNAHNICRASTR
jgi:hypothetical protein